jgi:hypothetical protein
MNAGTPWLGEQAKYAAYDFQTRLVDLDTSLDVELLPASKSLLRRAVFSNRMSDRFARFGVKLSKPPLVRDLLLHYSESTKDFRLYHVERDFATPDAATMLEHLSSIEEATPPPDGQTEPEQQLKEEEDRCPLLTGPILDELRDLSELQGPDEDCLIVSTLRSGMSRVSTLEVVSQFDLDQKYPISTNPPILKRSKSIYPFDIMSVGDVREIGPYSDKLLNRVRSAISTHKVKHPGTFKAVTDANHDKVLIWRET